MPRTIRADGRTIVVPDDATPEEINQIVGPAPKVPAPPDTRNAIQRGFDDLTTVTPEQEKGHSAIVNRAQEFGAGTIAGFGAPLVHPIETIKGFGKFGSALLGNRQDADEIVNGFKNAPIAQTAGNLVGGAVGGELAGVALKPLVPSVSEALKSTGGKMIDRAAGNTAKDFARNAQPGRAYLEGGGKPALTMARLGDQADTVATNSGSKLRDLYSSSTAKIPAPDVLDTLSKPLTELRNLQGGPGGTGVSPLLQKYEDNLLPPISAANTRGGFTPVELFDQVKKPIAQSTNWRDPSMFDLNKARQENVGGVGGLLTDAVPEAKPLNRIYQGATNLAGRATARAATGSVPLTTIGRRALELSTGGAAGLALGHPSLGVLPMMLDSVPAITTGGYGLFQAGRGLPAIPGVLPVLGAGSTAISPKPKPDNK